MATQSEKKIWGISPLRTVVVGVPEATRNAFFERLFSYAKSSSFQYKVSRFDPANPLYWVDMNGSKVSLSGNNAFSPEEFKLSFYANAESDSDYDRGEMLRVIDPFVENLKKALASPPSFEVRSTK